MKKAGRFFLGPGPGPARVPGGSGGGGGGGSPITLPFNYTLSGETTAAAGTVLKGNVTGWESEAARTTDWDVATSGWKTTAPAIPAGITRCFNASNTDNYTIYETFAFPDGKVFPAGVTKLRLACFKHQTNNVSLSRGTMYIGLQDMSRPDDQDPEIGPAPNYFRWDPSGFNYRISHRLYGRVDGVASTFCDVQGPDNPQSWWPVGDVWVGMKAEIDFTAKTAWFETKDMNNEGYNDKVVTASSLTLLPDALPQMTHFIFGHGNNNWQIYSPGFWVGTGDDAWPTLTGWPLTSSESWS